MVFQRIRYIVKKLLELKLNDYMEFNPLLPEFSVTDFDKSIHFYQHILGFKVEYTRDDPKFAFLSYGRSQLMIQELRRGEKEEERLDYPFGRGINFQIESENVLDILKKLEANNYPILRGVKDSWYQGNAISYGCREILVNDPDGYLLRFSQDIGVKNHT